MVKGQGEESAGCRAWATLKGWDGPLGSCSTHRAANPANSCAWLNMGPGPSHRRGISPRGRINK